MAHILVVDDEQDLLELVRYNLAQEGHRVDTANSGEAALTQVAKQPPALVVLDLMLPGISGLEVCRALKKSPDTRTIAILMLTARGEDQDVVRGLERGADDYVTKPFVPAVLVARVAALLRRQTTPPDPSAEGASTDIPALLKCGTLTIDSGRHQVQVAGAEVHLTPTEFRIVQLLASRPSWVFSRRQIVDQVMGEYHAVTERSVDVQVAGLRRKLGGEGCRIETVRGVGYRFSES